MSTTYTKSLSTDFGGSIKLKQLHKEIEDDGTIVPNIIGITMTGDVVDITFDSALSGSEETSLNSLIAAHTPNNSKPKETFYTETAQIDSTRAPNYTKVIRFIYPGSDSCGIIDYVEVLSRMNSGITSYDIRLVDKTNNTIMAEVIGLTNTTDSANDLGTISNIPTNKAVLEIHIKVNGANGNSFVYIDNAVIYHDN